MEPIGSLILMPTTDWLRPFGVHSHCGSVGALLGDDVRDAVIPPLIVTGAVELVADARVDRRIERDAGVSDRAVRGAQFSQVQTLA